MGVGPGATPDEIKRAFHRKAREFHPDVNKSPDAEDRFKELGEAYGNIKARQRMASLEKIDLNEFDLGSAEEVSSRVIFETEHVVLKETVYILGKKKKQLRDST